MSDRFCEYCGAPLAPFDQFCQACGKQPSQVDTEQAASVPVAPQQQPMQQYQTPMPPYQPSEQNYQAVSQPYGQQSHGYQPPVQNNPFAHFSDEMNTGNIQKKTAGRGMVLGGVIAMVVIALTVTSVVLVAGRPTAPKPAANAGTAQQAVGDANFPTADAGATVAVDIANAKVDATLADVVGLWKGEIAYLRMDGFDSVPKEELPPNFEEIIAQILSNPAPMTFEIEEDGNWDLNIDVVTGMRMDSGEYDRSRYPDNPMRIKALENGRFIIDFADNEDGNQTHLKLEFVLTKNSDALQGTLMLAMKNGKIDVVQEGRYILSPAA